MGRLGSIYRGDGAFSASAGLTHAAHRLRRDGALAGLVSGNSDGDRDGAPYQAIAQDAHQHLSGLLVPLDQEPETLAARLLYRFGSIGRIAQAPDHELRAMARTGEKWVDAFLVVRRLMYDGMRETLLRSRLCEDREALCSYLLMTMRHLPEERMLAVFADANGYVISEEIIAEGEAGHLLVTPRRVFTRALNLDARKILLAHNHPSGCAEPSPLDVKHTRLLARQATGLGLAIEDHLIVGGRVVTSMKDRGMI